MLNDANAGREWAPVKTYRHLVQIRTFIFLFCLALFRLFSLRRFQTQGLSSFRIRKTILEHSVYSRPNMNVDQGQGIY